MALAKLRYALISQAAAALAALALVLWSAPADAQIRINEVLANPLGGDSGNQKVELFNHGSSPVAIGGYRICVNFSYATLPAGVTVNPGQSYLLHIRASGANNSSNYYTGTSFPALNATGDSFGLYVPGTSSADFANSDKIVDYIEWGSPGQPRESVANAAGVWPAGQAVPAPSEGNSIQMCNPATRGTSAWSEAAPTLGSANNCGVPAHASTWGRVKSAYR